MKFVTLFIVGFLLHTAFLGWRVYILGRPPVSNMEETLLFVPWVAELTALSYFFFAKKKTFWPLFGAAILAIVLFLFLPKSLGKAPVAAVLNSHYWLTIHVLTVVASYGVLLLAGILAHLYLFGINLKKMILQFLYVGTFLLICGTILGGMWAHRSWGRFWDWDPKETWAFISCGVNLLIIHAYRFGKMGEKGLMMGAIFGMLVITFTWYGVNYILGTGLHSYGFGKASHSLYLAFVIFELALIGKIFFTKKTEIAKKGQKE